jgi:hypothetical protein
MSAGRPSFCCTTSEPTFGTGALSARSAAHTTAAPYRAVAWAVSAALCRARQRFSVIFNRLYMLGLISGTMMFFLHELPELVQPQYRGFLRQIRSPPTPVRAPGATPRVTDAVAQR